MLGIRKVNELTKKLIIPTLINASSTYLVLSSTITGPACVSVLQVWQVCSLGYSGAILRVFLGKFWLFCGVLGLFFSTVGLLKIRLICFYNLYNMLCFKISWVLASVQIPLIFDTSR